MKPIQYVPHNYQDQDVPHPLSLRPTQDIHNSPGGSQRGTYNGIWPLEPMFWKAEPLALNHEKCEEKMKIDEVKS